MKSFTVTDLRKNIYKIVEQTNATSERVHIYGKKGNAVLVSEDDWNAIQETLYLHAIPGMAASIREGMETPLSDTSEELDWRATESFTPNKPKKTQKNSFIRT